MYDARSLAVIDHQVELIAAAARRLPGTDAHRLTGHLYLLAEDLIGRDQGPALAMKARIQALIAGLTPTAVPHRPSEG